MDSAVTRLPGVLFCGMIRLSLIASEEHMPMMACGRRDISDSIREKPEPRLPGREGSRDGGRERRPPGHEPRKGGLNTKSHLTADAQGMPVRALSHGARQRIALGQSLRLTDLQQKDFWRTRATTGMGFSPGPKGGWKRPFLLRKTARGGVIATGSLAGPDV